MKHVLSFALACLGTALAISACDDHHGHGHGGFAGGGKDLALQCAQLATCGACTPVEGCGWCSVAGGGGACLTDPDDCDAQQFSWTWDPQGCAQGADAGIGTPVTPVTPVDAGTAPLPTPVDAAPPTSNDAAEMDASAFAPADLIARRARLRDAL